MKDVKKKVKTKKINILTEEKIGNKNFNLMLLVTFFLGVLLIFSTYAWFQASLDVDVKFMNLVVSKKNGLFISLDGIEFGSSVEISRDVLIKDLKRTYPSHTSQWAKYGLTPISSNGILNKDSKNFEMYAATNFDVDPITGKSYLSTKRTKETKVSEYKDFIAFDIFLKNVTGSPVSDNLYIDEGTNVLINDGYTEQIQGLINSIRIGLVKIGTVDRDSSIEEIQNMECNNNCEMIIYEPNSTAHTDLSIERAKKYGINLIDGQYYPTYAVTGEMKFFEIKDVITGNPGENFKLQETRVDNNQSIFEIPDGITKVRVYVWIEGQDIDSLETRSEGADVSVLINLMKDTAGYDAFNE